jgi:dephospho-CoA kinase
VQETSVSAARTDGVPRVIGLTGGIASGKSTVGRLLRERGATVIDADEVARAVVEPGTPTYERIVAAFGRQILRAAPSTETAPPLDREKLAALVFADEAARSQLNKLTHPAVAAESGRRLAAAALAGAPVIVYEVPLLVENNLQHGLAGVIVVDVPEEVQLARAMKRSGMSREQAQARMAAQSRRAVRLAAANWVIDNSGDEAATTAQVAALWPALCNGAIPPRRGES